MEEIFESCLPPRSVSYGECHKSVARFYHQTDQSRLLSWGPLGSTGVICSSTPPSSFRLPTLSNIPCNYVETCGKVASQMMLWRMFVSTLSMTCWCLLNFLLPSNMSWVWRQNRGTPSGILFRWSKNTAMIGFRWQRLRHQVQRNEFCSSIHDSPTTQRQRS